MVNFKSLITPVEVNILFSVKYDVVILLLTVKMCVIFATHLRYTQRTHMLKLLSLAFIICCIYVATYLFHVHTICSSS